MQPELAHRQHDHSQCINSAIESAKTRCRERGVRFTPQREAVFRLLWDSHQPLGAYTILEKLSELGGKMTAPPTVYRALTFLEEQGLVHHLPSINAWLGCRCPEQHHNAQFFICSCCQQAMEITSATITDAIRQSSSSRGFTVQKAQVEVLGLCPNCQKQDNREARA